METTATFTPAITVTDVDGAITDISIDWSESLSYLNEDGEEAVEHREFDAYSMDGPGCVAFDNAEVQRRILSAVRAAIYDQINNR